MCSQCGHKAVALATVDYHVQIDHDGRKYTLTVPSLRVPRCGDCGAVYLDEDANRAISAAFRAEAGLLPPEEIRAGRKRLALTQKELAARLQLADSTLSRWETGAQIQQRALDVLLRTYFAVEPARQFIDGLGGFASAAAGVSPVRAASTTVAVLFMPPPGVRAGGLALAAASGK
jgi:putative zinc finger/helix-turn-helix YgiT family protein